MRKEDMKLVRQLPNRIFNQLLRSEISNLITERRIEKRVVCDFRQLVMVWRNDKKKVFLKNDNKKKCF